MKTKESQYGLI